MVYSRSIISQLKKDLNKKMVLMAGPRQCGKTTIAVELVTKKSHYLNWDIPDHREIILEGKWPDTPGIFALDEIHKFTRWRALLKGLYDARHDDLKILVTGSAKLGVYHYGGDSLQGRYFLHRLHPLTVAELKISCHEDLLTLFNLNGFPEPFFSGSQQEQKRWSRQYRSLLIQEDLRDLEKVTELGLIEQLALRLPTLVASPLSTNSLREDLQVAHKTIQKWCDILERLYYIYRVYPFGAPNIRAIKKMPKHYHFDWGLVTEVGARFENFIACHLLKWVHHLQDCEGRDLELRYFRDTDKREVDFIIVENDKPLYAIECKAKSKGIDSNLKYFKSKFPSTNAIQVELDNNRSYKTKDGIEVLSALQFLSKLI